MNHKHSNTITLTTTIPRASVGWWNDQGVATTFSCTSKCSLGCLCPLPSTAGAMPLPSRGHSAVLEIKDTAPCSCDSFLGLRSPALLLPKELEDAAALPCRWWYEGLREETWPSEALQLVWLASTTLVCLRSCRQAYEKELSTLAVYLRHILHIAFPAGPLPSWQVTQLWERWKCHKACCPESSAITVVCRWTMPSRGISPALPEKAAPLSPQHCCKNKAFSLGIATSDLFLEDYSLLTEMGLACLRVKKAQTLCAGTKPWEKYIWGFCLVSGSLALSQPPQSVYIWMLYGICTLPTEQVWNIGSYVASVELPLSNWKTSWFISFDLLGRRSFQQ